MIGQIKSGNRKYRDDYVVLGAHFDHVGKGGPGSGSRTPDLLEVHPGADDNASGTSGLLEIAQKLAANKSKLKRSVLLIGFDAEEKGLLGSKYFVDNPTIELGNIVTMIESLIESDGHIWSRNVSRMPSMAVAGTPSTSTIPRTPPWLMMSVRTVTRSFFQGAAFGIRESPPLE